MFTPMIAVGKLSSFKSSLVGKLFGYQEIQVHSIHDENYDKIDDKESKRGDSEDSVEEAELKNSKLSLFDSGTVLV